MEECDGVGYGEGIFGQGFTPIVWGLVCIAKVDERGACENVVYRMGSSLLQKEQYSGWRCETK